MIEKVIHDQTQSFLHKMILFTDISQVFRNIFPLIHVYLIKNKIATDFESGLYTSIILIDLQKELDTVNHDIFIKKTKLAGFSEGTTKWFKSYLPNRKSKVHIQNTFSEPGNLLCGVPHRSF